MAAPDESSIPVDFEMEMTSVEDSSSSGSGLEIYVEDGKEETRDTGKYNWRFVIFCNVIMVSCLVVCPSI